MDNIVCHSLGCVACLLVLCTFAMTSMRHLRMVAMASNVSFISYAWIFDLWPILALHVVLLPLNAVRLVQIGRGSSKRSTAQWIARICGRTSSPSLR